jgi:hypothetical protein
MQTTVSDLTDTMQFPASTEARWLDTLGGTSAPTTRIQVRFTLQGEPARISIKHCLVSRTAGRDCAVSERIITPAGQRTMRPDVATTTNGSRASVLAKGY